MEKGLETIACSDMKAPAETLLTLKIAGSMARTAFYEAAGIVTAGIVLAAYAGYEIVSAFYK
jgi:hypothetical protein